MNEEEFKMWRDYKTEDDLKELIQVEQEMEKILKKEEKEKVNFEIFFLNKYFFFFNFDCNLIGKRTIKTRKEQTERISQRT